MKEKRAELRFQLQLNIFSIDKTLRQTFLIPKYKCYCHVLETPSLEQSRFTFTCLAMTDLFLTSALKCCRLHICKKHYSSRWVSRKNVNGKFPHWNTRTAPFLGVRDCFLSSVYNEHGHPNPKKSSLQGVHPLIFSECFQPKVFTENNDVLSIGRQDSD